MRRPVTQLHANDNSDSDNDEGEQRDFQSEIDDRIHNFGRTYCVVEGDEEDGSDDDYDRDIDNSSCNGNHDICELKERMRHACNCKGDSCLQSFSLPGIRDSILTTNELSREERDLYIMGKLSCVGHGSKTERGKERKRKRYAYYFQGKKTCKGAFLLLYGVSTKYVKI